MAGEGAEMDSLFEGMDFVMPLEEGSQYLVGSNHTNLKTKAFEAQEVTQEGSKPSAPVSEPLTLNSPSLDPTSLSSGGELGMSSTSSITGLSSPPPNRTLSESLSPAPASSPSYGGLHRNPSEPLDESLFSGLTMLSADDETTTEPPNSVDPSEVRTNTTTGISGTGIVTKAVVDSIEHERSRSFDDPASGGSIGNGDKNGGSTESIMAVYNDASPYLSLVKQASSGTPPISKKSSGSPSAPSPSLRPSMRRKKRSMKIGYGREEEENEELASRKAGIREAIGATLLGKDALNASSTSTPRNELSRESSQSTLHVEESTLESSRSGDSTHLNGVELIKEPSSRIPGSQYSTLEVHGIERVASRELSDEVTTQLASSKPDVYPIQCNIITDVDEEGSPRNDQSHSPAVEETSSQIEVAAEPPCTDPEGTAPDIETGHAVHDQGKGGALEAIQDKEDELDFLSLAQQGEGTIEERLEYVQEAVAYKVKVLHERITVISALRKAAVQKRRQTSENVAIASAKYKELEAELDAACEREDFEKADSLSGSIVEAETNMAQAEEAFTVAEADYDLAALKVQEVLDLQVAIEEKAAKFLELLKQEAEDAAEIVLKEAQGTASQEMERLMAEEKTAVLKQQKLDLQLKEIEEANTDLNNAIEELTQSESKEKVELTEQRNQLGVELQDLIALVKMKEAEIADYDERIAAVNDKVSNVAATFETQKTGLDMELETLTTSALQLEKDCSLISEGKQEIAQRLADAEQERNSLENIARLACDAARAMQDTLGIKMAVAVAITQSREKRTELVEKEKQAQAEAHILRQNAASTRVLLQELSSTKVKLSEDLGAVKDRIIFVEKRGPELDTEKKLAAAARNFKVAGRLAAEAKVLTAEKEAASVDMERIMKELEKVDEEAEAKLGTMATLDDLVAGKEKEGAMARCERLRLVAAATRDERDFAAELDDFEEAESLNSEANAADAEAEVLQKLYHLEGRQFEIYSKSKLSEDADPEVKEAAMVSCEKLRLVAAVARNERDVAVELDQFEEAETLHSKAETADAEADRVQRLHQLEGRQFESQTDLKVTEDVDLKDKLAAMADCERLRLVAATARYERDTAVEVDEFEEAEIFDSKAEAADAQADKIQKLFQLEGTQYQRQIKASTDED